MSTRLKYISLYTSMWMAVIGFSLAGAYFNTVLMDTTFELRHELPFLARWIIWIPLTPLAIWLAGKMMYAEHKPGSFFSYHLSIYMAITVVHIFLASLTAYFINVLLHQPASYEVILKKCALTGLFYNFVIYTLIVLVINGIRHYQALQAEKITTLRLGKSLSESRLSFLKQQLQPHFLFNTHHSIITLMKMGEKEKAVGMLEKLSDLMRVALHESEEQKVTLKKEIETLHLYLDIQKVRFEDKMTVVYDIEDITNNALVPSMILQPIVENSIKHGVERSPTDSSISISASTDDNKLNITIKDRIANAKFGNNINKGTGISNSEERLSKLYGSDANLVLQPYINDGHGGMEVQISIPLQYAAM